MDYYIELGKLFKKRRLELNMMQVDVAEKADISNNFYSSIERGKTKLSVETLIKITKALRLSIDPVIFDDGTSKNDTYIKTAIRDLDNMLKDRNNKEIEDMVRFCDVFSTVLKNFIEK